MAVVLAALVPAGAQAEALLMESDTLRLESATFPTSYFGGDQKVQALGDVSGGKAERLAAPLPIATAPSSSLQIVSPSPLPPPTLVGGTSLLPSAPDPVLAPALDIDLVEPPAQSLALEPQGACLEAGTGGCMRPVPEPALLALLAAAAAAFGLTRRRRAARR